MSQWLPKRLRSCLRLPWIELDGGRSPLTVLGASLAVQSIDYDGRPTGRERD